MKIRTFSLLYSLSLAILIAPLSAVAVETLLMQVTTIDGTALDTNHVNWHPIQTVGWNVERPVDMGDLNNPSAYAAKALFSKIVITRNFDYTSPEFFLSVVLATVQSEIKLEFTQLHPTLNTRVPYFTVYLKNARIDKLSQSADGDNIPTETIVIAYEAIKLESKKLDGGNLVPAESGQWNVKFNSPTY